MEKVTVGLDEIDAKATASALTWMDHEVILLSRDSPDGDLEDLQPRSRILPILLGRYGRFGIFHYLLALLVGLKETEARPVEAVYERGHALCVGLVVAKLRRLPYVTEINGILEDVAGSRLMGLPRLVLRTLCRAMASKADRIIVVSQGLARYVENVYGARPEKVSVIHNGVDDRLRPVDPERARESVKLKDDRHYVCFVGNLAPWAGVRTIIECAKSVIEALPDTMFLIVGDGSTRNQMIELVDGMGLSSHFLFTGLVPHRLVPHHINASDLCLAPYPRNINHGCGFSPMKIYAYLACGKYVVASDLPCLRDRFGSSPGVTLVEPEEPSALAEAIVTLLQSRVATGRMGRKAGKIVRGQYGWEAIGRRYLSQLSAA